MWIIRAFSFFFLVEGKIVQVFVFCNLCCLCLWGHGGGMRVASWVIPVVGTLAVFGLPVLVVSLSWQGDVASDGETQFTSSLCCYWHCCTVREAGDVSPLLLLVFLVVWILLQWGEGAGFSGADTVAVPFILHHGPCFGSTPCLLHHSFVHWGHMLSHGGQGTAATGTVPVLPPLCITICSPFTVQVHGSLRYSSVLSRGMFVGLQMLGHLYIDLRGDTKEWSHSGCSLIHFLNRIFQRAEVLMFKTSLLIF